MTITKEQKEFIKKMAPGIHVYLGSGNRMEDIYEKPEGEIEHFIKNNLLGREKNELRTTRVWFCETTFCEAVDTLIDEKLKDVLFYFDAHDMPLCDVYIESCLRVSDLSETETKWSERLIEGSMMTFKDFLS